MMPVSKTPPAEPNVARGVVWRSPGWIIAASALCVSLLCFGSTLGGYFLGDDFGYVGRFHDFPLTSWPRLFVQEWSGGIWGFELRELRPMTALSFIVDVKLWGANALGYRVTNLLMHATCATLVGLLAWRAAGRDLICGVFGAVLFALHPAHVEPVLWITGRVDMLSTLFYVGGFAAFLRYREDGGWGWLLAVVASYGAAAFSKEFGLTLPLMLLAADILWLTSGRSWRRGKTWAPYLGCVAVVLGYYFCRHAAFGGGGVGTAMPDFKHIDFYVKLAERQLTYFGHLLPPLERWLLEGTPVIGRQALWVFGLSAAGVVTVFVFWRSRAKEAAREPRAAALFFGLGWYLVATLPLVITYISPRHLYLASAGLCVALALVIRGALRSRVMCVSAAAAVIALFGVRLVKTSAPWRDAGVRSRDVARELAFIEREAKPGAALLFDVPHETKGAMLAAFAVPFAVRPPFTRTPLDERFIVVEDMAAYFDWGRWHEQPAIAKLLHVTEESWLVLGLDGAPVRRVAIPAAKLQAAARRFVTAPLKQEPHPSWRKMVDDAMAP